MEVATFQISNADINKFRRLITKPKDCVINALELINVLDGKNADFMRISVGDIGLTLDKIEQIFSYVSHVKKIKFQNWKFLSTPNINDLDTVVQNLKPGYVIFCGYEKNGFAHVFLIGKTDSGVPMYIDPQVNALCDLRDPTCTNYITNAQMYYVLHYS